MKESTEEVVVLADNKHGFQVKRYFRSTDLAPKYEITTRPYPITTTSLTDALSIFESLKDHERYDEEELIDDQ